MPKHDPERRHLLSDEARTAARVSHARRADPDVEAWAETLDFTTDEGRARGLTEVAQLVAKGGLTPSQGATIAALARAAEPKTTKPVKAQPVIVEVQRFGGQNGQEARS